VDLSRAWEAATRSASQEFPFYEDHRRIHKSHTLVSVLSQMAQSNLILSSHFCVGRHKDREKEKEKKEKKK
jgi:hypothetical protein